MISKQLDIEIPHTLEEIAKTFCYSEVIEFTEYCCNYYIEQINYFQQLKDCTETRMKIRHYEMLLHWNYSIGMNLGFIYTRHKVPSEIISSKEIHDQYIKDCLGEID